MEIGALALEAMLYEVSATPKPGLVDRRNNGAHGDMDFFTFMSSAAALRKHFDGFAALGREHRHEPLPSLLPCLQKAGLEAERDMFLMTGGVNTHKGMIFSLGILTGAAGWGKARGEALTAEHLGELAAAMCEGLCRKAFGGTCTKNNPTKGEAMYAAYGVTGARGEAEGGFPTARKVALPVYRKLRESSLGINEVLVETLLHIMANSTDTNILGRHDMQAMEYVRKTAAAALQKGGVHTPEGRGAIDEMDEEFIRRWISPGGCADILAVTHFLYETERIFA